MDISVRLEPWAEDDFWLLLRKNEPVMTAHLGGPESEAKLRDRHRRYLALSAREPGAGRMFRVVADGESVGSIGFWERVWNEEEVYEAGWAVLPEFQGRGLAAAAARALVVHAGAHGTRRHLHAFPGVDHPASAAVCRAAGFELRGEVRFEYPPGTWHMSGDWRAVLGGGGHGGAS
ncbi:MULTISPECIES: GNAT family N-acetyltransferase [unclassified Streptomyces]|uniref:GNAT family N-acetyltransferase n=1 Tax=unclassified Streptomyces TaxID=2593676 RepID=UPI000DC78814|nr:MULTISPECIES: GNAT family N-acetyltransferase [unclassified Streptomyces]AWZ03863.1 GNAT family N-acetyltransferase [Streptomyces sp. ICC4]AWZ11911.1 GNAT family N-acetyltransferase [Streptomyces sp. ICC1]